MSRSNYDKPFYVDVGTSIVAIRCASNHDVLFEYDFEKCPQVIGFAKDTCDRMNKEAIGRSRRNCDVGTPEEQTRRMDNEYCYRQKECYESPSGKSCPLYKPGVDCRLTWAQMPYKEGGDDGVQSAS